MSNLYFFQCIHLKKSFHLNDIFLATCPVKYWISWAKTTLKSKAKHPNAKA